MYATKLLWTGLFLVLALNTVLDLVGLNSSDVIVKVGAVIMLVGVILLWLDK